MHQLSETEYIAKIRKKVNTVHRLRWLWPTLFLCYFGLFIWFIENLERFEIKPDQYKVYGFVSGVIAGLFFCFTAFQAVYCLRYWWEAYRGWRTERLLLKYYDEQHANQRGHGTH
jgi:hypothetical protein